MDDELPSRAPAILTKPAYGCSEKALDGVIEQAQVGDRVPLAISGKDECCWSGIVNFGITWRRWHDRLLSGARIST
jgi:hypothetical protein